MIKGGIKATFRAITLPLRYNFASKPKSYYELLDVKPTCTHK